MEDSCRVMFRFWLNIHEAALILMERTRGTCDFSRLKRHSIPKRKALLMREGNRHR